MAAAVNKTSLSPLAVPARAAWMTAARPAGAAQQGLRAFEQIVIKGDGGQPSGQPTPSDRQALTGTPMH